MEKLPPNAALILIDIQQGMDDAKWGARNNPHAETNAAAMLAAWRASQRPVIHVRHASKNKTSPLHPDYPGHQIKDMVAPLPEETLFTKQENSAFIGTALEAHLRAKGIATLVLCGLTTQHCVSTTVRMAGNLGFTCFLAEDAVAAFAQKDHRGKEYDAETVHAVSLATLHDEFATVVATKDILAAV
ncbi:MAG TPA: cysteine hydrolase family protein [Candidatus Acidoferrum sp.]|nr:cysteine hydrolase family protein [Candidatus Acidoferrum sp.]